MKIIAVGDPGQLAVRPGRRLARHPRPPATPARSCARCIRQRDPAERAALEALHDGNPEPTSSTSRADHDPRRRNRRVACSRRLSGRPRDADTDPQGVVHDRPRQQDPRAAQPRRPRTPQARRRRCRETGMRHRPHRIRARRPHHRPPQRPPRSTSTTAPSRTIPPSTRDTAPDAHHHRRPASSASSTCPTSPTTSSTPTRSPATASQGATVDRAGRHRPPRRVHPRMGLHRPVPRPSENRHPPHRRPRSCRTRPPRIRTRSARPRTLGLPARSRTRHGEVRR